jgi:hypothetical protein
MVVPEETGPDRFIPGWQLKNHDNETPPKITPGSFLPNPGAILIVSNLSQKNLGLNPLSK